MIDLFRAIYAVARRRAQRIAVPGRFKVWRENGRVRFEVLNKGN